MGLIQQFDHEDFAVHIGAEVKDWKPEEYIDPKEARRCDRFAQFALAAAAQAVKDAGLTIDESNAADVGVVIGSGIGGMWTCEKNIRVLAERGPSRVSPFTIPMLIPDMGAGLVSIHTGASGPNYCVASACASATHSLGDAFNIIRRGAAKAMISGGSEAAICPISVAAFAAAKAVSFRNEDPLTACRPFDKSRDGFVIGEGACILVLEQLEHAVSRGAQIYAEIIGYGASGDAYNIVAPDPSGRGALIAMEAAIRDAGISADEIDYVNAHAPGTPGGDDMEARALRNLFPGNYSPAVNSTKPIHGHQLGATGGTELAIAIKVMHESLVPRTLNSSDLDDDIAIDVVMDENRPMRVDTVMNNNFGFGGHNAVMIARKYEG
jgi:3-oxoacyl-[acyl-carrier-protein] synthase II